MMIASPFKQQPFSTDFKPMASIPFNGTAVYDNVNITGPLKPHPRHLDENAKFVVNGASRGIGLQVVKDLLQRTRGQILACCRDPSQALALQNLMTESKSSGRITTFSLDMTDQLSIDAVAKHVQHVYGGRVDGLWNVAGFVGDGITTPGPEKSLATIDRRWLEQSFAVHVVGPTMLIQALAPYLKRERRHAPSIVVNVSARVASASDNVLGGWHSYRMSKCALNQATRTLASELKRQGTWIIAVHPGMTDTDFSKPFQGRNNAKPGRLFPVAFTTTRLMDILDGMEEKHTGGFYDWAGIALPY